ncbi:MAG: DUF5684 domain-containing protein [Saccharofermentans sp.]|nr:DUF5684 domain-containing protein [Saccharofermentans sp.]
MYNEPKIYPDWKPSTLSIVIAIISGISYLGLFLSPMIFTTWMLVAPDDPYTPLIVMYIYMMGVALFMSIIMLISQWRIFTRAGKGGWECLIPVYNTWTLYEIAGYQGYYCLFAFIPFVGSIFVLVMTILVSMSLALKFGKSKTWGIVMLALLSPIGFPILGLSQNTYIESAGHDKSEGLFE